MRIELLEKIVFIVAIMAIVLVGGVVIFFTVVPKESGISREEIDADESVNKWYRDAVAQANNQPLPSQNKILLDARNAPAQATTTPAMAGAKPGTPAAGGANQPAVQQKTGEDYIRTNGDVPPAERVDQSIPWLRREPGVTYTRPEPVSELQYQKYQSFEDVMEVAQQGGGEFVNGRYKINWIGENSALANKLGLQPGDEVISVNGLPVGNSFNASTQMYNQLKGQKKFAVKISRGGSDMVLSYYVGG